MVFGIPADVWIIPCLLAMLALTLLCIHGLLKICGKGGLFSSDGKPHVRHTMTMFPPPKRSHGS
jgi:hypothetical protein